MQIYSTELLAAAAFIASLSIRSASGSEIAQPELSISDRSHDREDGATEKQALQTKDEVEKEARMEPLSGMSALSEAAKGKLHDIPGSTVATAVRTRLAQLNERFAEALMEHSESSEMAAKRIRQDPNGRSDVPSQATDAALLSEAEATRIIEQAQANPTFLSAEQQNGLEKLVEEINAGHWDSRTLWDQLIVNFGDSDDGLTKLASALRKAKANGVLHESVVHALEEEMLIFWKAKNKPIEKAFVYLELDKLMDRGGLMEENLRLLTRYLVLFYENRRGRRKSVPKVIVEGLGVDKLLPMIGPAWGKYEGAIELLRILVFKWAKYETSVETIMKKLQKVQMSDPMTLRLLLTLVDQKRLLLQRENLNRLMEALKDSLVTHWVTKKTSVDDVYTMLNLSDQSNPDYFDVRMDISKKFVAALESKHKDDPNALSAALAYEGQALTRARFEEGLQKRQRIEGHQVEKEDWSWLDLDEGFGDINMIVDGVR